ncbi:MAG: tRNA (adenosine(37)-N6)-threonylcarbamoyltransferase complex ATPase subunit type 1 TsaE [Candidatus Cloacimonas sp.]|nr:tRNA (adenosine(37)-N6)-threonylcarbamoyltransferase complex ATPase subunit type 1 TsaE [Candidatus Cloacimonadota bacterium]
MTRNFILKSEEDTTKLAKSIAPHLSIGDIIALDGTLGVGKTFFTKQLGLELGVKEVINSPTFVLVNIYQGDKLKLFHIDLYRLKNNEDIWSLGIEEMLDEGVVVIEWPELAQPLMRGRTFKLNFSFDENDRKVELNVPTTVKIDFAGLTSN